MGKKTYRSLDVLRKQVHQLIKEEYRTVEKFCERNKFSTGTISDFLNGTKDPRLFTIEKIAKALKRKLIVKIQ